MLILNEKDMRRAITFKQVMDKVEDAYRIFASGCFNMPERPVVMNNSDTILYMPCFMEQCFGTKFLTLYPENPGKGLPYIDGLMLFNDVDTGKTLSIMDAAFLTALRTGAVGGVGMRCFSPLETDILALIGCGKQGFYQVLYACEARDIKEVYLFDPYAKNLANFVEGLQNELGAKAPAFHTCASASEAIAPAQAVITATPATAPVLPDDSELLRGKTYIAIGSYKHEMRELPDAIWSLLEQVYTELPFALEESGDLYHPLAAGLFKEEQVLYMGDLLTQYARPKPPKLGETRYFKSVGMGLLDLNVSQLIYEQALKNNLGQQVDF